MNIPNSYAFFHRKLNHFSKIFYPSNFHSNHFFLVHFTYFFTLSIAGYLALSFTSQPRVPKPYSPQKLDLYFTSVSASTVSSMSTMEMETFSNSQLGIITTLMLLGGEIFTSLLTIQLKKFKLKNCSTSFLINRTELNRVSSITYLQNPNRPSLDLETCNLKLNSIKCLSYVVLGYLLVIHIVGSILVYSYVTLFSSRNVLKLKGIEPQTFSIFTTVSSFSNCGFIPTNENMIVFKENSGLLLLIILQILLGNTLYPVFLRIVIFVLGKITKREEFFYLMRNYGEVGYDHLFSGIHSSLLALTSFGFISVQLILFCAMEWNFEAMDGMSSYQKFVASLFQIVNSRHAGESVFDISLVSPAILVLFVVMMYLPPYTCILPSKDQDNKASTTSGDTTSTRKTLFECLVFSNLTYLAIFVVLICISEKESMKNDPLNFNVLNVVIEVISAYGNVGFSAGYSCKRRLNQDGDCTDMWYGFSGKWSSKGKLLLIMVMFFGRLKKFNTNGGKDWDLA